MVLLLNRDCCAGLKPMRTFPRLSSICLAVGAQDMAQKKQMERAVSNRLPMVENALSFTRDDPIVDAAKWAGEDL